MNPTELPDRVCPPSSEAAPSTHETERLEWDPAKAVSFYDAYGEREWTRFQDGTSPGPSLDVHLHYLRQYVHAGDRVLEVGAGPGRFTIEMARMGADVVATDLSPVQLDWNRRRVAEAGLEPRVLERAIADVTDLSRWKDASFDATVCYGGPISYVVDQADRGISELVRVTRPGGHVLVSVISVLGVLLRFLPEVVALVRRDGAPRNEAILLSGLIPQSPDYGHLAMKMYRWSELQALLARHGTIVAASAAGLLPIVKDAEPEIRDFLTRIEIELAREPGALSCGDGILAVLKKDR